MILDILISLFILPNIWQTDFQPEEFVMMYNHPVQEELVEPQKLYTDVLDVVITAEKAIAVDVKSGKILYQNNSDEVASIASITKLMTALVFLDHNPGWQKQFSTIANDRRNGGIIHLNTGDSLTINNLFKTALIASDNDAAMALSRSTGLSPDVFVDKMNQKADELGMINSEFADPTGLKYGNQSTVKDLVKLIDHALENDMIRETTSTAYYEFQVKDEEKERTVELRNTDWLVSSSYLDVVGGKTGSLEKAGYCLSVKIKGDDDQEIIVVVLGSQTNFDRFQDVKAISDFVFTNYNWN